MQKNPKCTCNKILTVEEDVASSEAEVDAKKTCYSSYTRSNKMQKNPKCTCNKILTVEKDVASSKAEVDAKIKMLENSLADWMEANKMELSYLNGVDKFRQWKLENNQATEEQITLEMIVCLPRRVQDDRNKNKFMYKSVVVVDPVQEPSGEIHRLSIQITYGGYSLAKETLIGGVWIWNSNGQVINTPYEAQE